MQRYAGHLLLPPEQQTSFKNWATRRAAPARQESGKEAWAIIGLKELMQLGQFAEVTARDARELHIEFHHVPQDYRMPDKAVKMLGGENMQRSGDRLRLIVPQYVMNKLSSQYNAVCAER